jgi:DNA-binding MarR family transcriptional regulator
MFEGRKSSKDVLEPMEAQVLRMIKSKPQTEGKISKQLQIDPLVLSPVVTDLILKGYLEMLRRRRFHFFTREVCTITAEGISALERTKTPFQAFIDMIQKRAMETLDDIVAESPTLRIVALSARTFYKVAKAIA